MSSTRKILIVGNIEFDTGQLEKALADLDHEVELTHFEPCEDLIPHLTALMELPFPLKPDLMLFDLSKDSELTMQTLNNLKNNSPLKSLPVIILADPKIDNMLLRRCYVSNANAVVTLPDDYEGFVQLIIGICEFWFDSVKLPSNAFAY
jgi:CheY-like chemotaxis protein